MQRDYRTAGFVRLCFEKLLPLMVLNLLFLLTWPAGADGSRRMDGIMPRLPESAVGGKTAVPPLSA